jgi:hypothetical protein
MMKTSLQLSRSLSSEVKWILDFLLPFQNTGFEDKLRPILSPTRDSMMGIMKFVRNSTIFAPSRQNKICSDKDVSMILFTIAWNSLSPPDNWV